jgi:hypothetical protein
LVILDDDTHRLYTFGITDWRVPHDVSEAALTCGSGCLWDAQVVWTQMAKREYKPKDYSPTIYDHADDYLH